VTRLVTVVALGDRDVHVDDDPATALAVALKRRTADARIGVGFGDVARAKTEASLLRGLAEPGAILASHDVQRVVATGRFAFVELGFASLAGYADRVAVYELDGAVQRERAALCVCVVAFLRVHAVGQPGESEAAADARLLACDRLLFQIAADHGGFVHDVDRGEYVLMLASADAALRAAVAVHARWQSLPRFGRPACGVHCDVLSYRGGRWHGDADLLARRIAGRGNPLGITRRAIDRLAPELSAICTSAPPSDVLIKGRVDKLEVFDVEPSAFA
jgi:class 3 adenylate cyclase